MKHEKTGTISSTQSAAGHWATICSPLPPSSGGGVNSTGAGGIARMVLSIVGASEVWGGRACFQAMNEC